MIPLSEGAQRTERIESQNLLWSDIPEEVQRIVEALREKKVEFIRVYDLRKFTPFCDFVVLGTVYSSAQVRVAQESCIRVMDEEGIRLWGIEGNEDSVWVLIDFWDTVVHLFRPEARRYYNLEALWADMPWWPGEISG